MLSRVIYLLNTLKDEENSLGKVYPRKSKSRLIANFPTTVHFFVFQMTMDPLFATHLKNIHFNVAFEWVETLRDPTN